MNKGTLQYQQDMLHLVKEWKQSGMSQRVFSASKGVSYQKLIYWNKKFNKLNINTEQILPLTDSTDFISIEIPKEADSFSGLQLTYPNQVTITCPSGIELDTLKSLIKLF